MSPTSRRRCRPVRPGRICGWCCGCSTATSPAGCRTPSISTSRAACPGWCAPAFAAAMLDRDVLATIPVDRHALLVAAVQVLPGSPLDGAPLRPADRPLSVRVIGLSAPDSEWVDWSPDPSQPLAAGDRILVVARRAGLRELLQSRRPRRYRSPASTPVSELISTAQHGLLVRFVGEHIGEIGLHRRAHADVAAGLFGQQPLVLDDLREDLLRLELAAQVRRNGPDHRLEDLGEPAVGGLLLVGEVALRPVGVQVVEQLPGLVLLRRPGRSAGTAGGCGSRRRPPWAGPGIRRPRWTTSTSATSKPRSLSRLIRRSTSCRTSRGTSCSYGDLVPESLVPGHDVVDHRLRVDRLVQQLGRLQIEALAEDVHRGGSRCPRGAGRWSATGTGCRSRRPPGTRRRRPRPGGTACWTASSHPS